MWNELQLWFIWRRKYIEFAPSQSRSMMLGHVSSQRGRRLGDNAALARKLFRANHDLTSSCGRTSPAYIEGRGVCMDDTMGVGRQLPCDSLSLARPASVISLSLSLSLLTFCLTVVFHPSPSSRNPFARSPSTFTCPTSTHPPKPHDLSSTLFVYLSNHSRPIYALPVTPLGPCVNGLHLSSTMPS